MSRFLSSALCLAVLWPLSAAAGTLYGTVRIGTTPAAGVTVKVACPGFGAPGRPPPGVAGEATTDARGSYSLRLEFNGPCKIQLQREGRVGAPFDGFVSNNSLRLDIEADGNLNKVR